MDIGRVIRKYRKEMGITQEEMANRLGVTTPAVNKWENGNSNPDIELLSPIARLLNISPDILLSYHEKLTDTEIAEIIKEMDRMFSNEGYEKTYDWAMRIVNEYPNCNMLIWQVAVILDARRVTQDCKEPDKYDEQINTWYEIVLNDENEEVRYHAAESLFCFHLRKKNYLMAEKYLSYFSEHDPLKKIYLGRLYKEQGKKEEAYEMFESIIFSMYNTLNLAFSFMVGLSLEENDLEYARFLSEKMCTLSNLFEMGKYNECSSLLNVVCAEKNIEETYKVVKQLLENVDSLYDFQKSKLYRHKKFRNIDSTSYFKEIKEKLLDGFKDENDFGYMRGYEPWENLVRKNNAIV